jgi:hypothetical protein
VVLLERQGKCDSAEIKIRRYADTPIREWFATKTRPLENLKFKAKGLHINRCP